ncbi:trifunctional serine/threonine-protein kinase/ATP-binding protein/sensor histidine kinase [Candidatus Phyllobacterium onerii]|uniref:trifunctional serine/threonine-protein kinase/ATP-binding protein/sensor histidine kinase n=1 Tax=Candidatus Phyllobacterium onerii TaxID=3020828 RepID=UPI00233156C4|nr:AAA family ATPase [Phyllobacterium sp. IY22]
MAQFSEYSFDVLRSGGEFTLYRGRASGRRPILGLAANGHRPSDRHIERLVHEHGLAPELDPAWATRPLGLMRHKGQDVLVLEDSGGEPLDLVLGRLDQRWELGRALAIAIDLTSAVGQMHRQGLIHKDIKPANVLLDDEERTRLMGFGLASRLRSERRAPAPPEVIAGTFAYMAPEQTGRMNRSVDTRSDLYSLGVTFYELFTGNLPFTASDPMEWIHCHIAMKPLPPSEHVDGLPNVLDSIILKLLSKNPEDRYQTASGLEYDLRKCLTSWTAKGSIADFPVGQHDVSDRLLIPEKLYGRDSEIAALLAAARRSMIEGTCELVLVSGYAGIGKSSIVNELHKVLVPQRGLFAVGKFDQYKRDIPYATLAQAFQGLVRQLLSKSDAELAGWRKELLAALGANGQLMIYLIPELALIIGEQPPIPPVDPQTAQARFHLVFRNLLEVFAKPEHPLVIFIDDLQWLDTATLELLERLITDPEVRHLMIIGAYRDNEVGEKHPLYSTLASIRRSRGVISEITLGPLKAVHLAQLCADALVADTQKTRPLAKLLLDKTGGNPFFAIQFITALADERLITFDPESSSWHWDIRMVRAKGITDNVAQLMLAKLNRLPLATQKALGVLACLGSAAKEGTVALVLVYSKDLLYATFQDAVEAGLLFHGGSTFAFTHDRVQEASYALIPHAERDATHLQIGRILLAQTPSAELEDNIFEIVNQFNRSGEAIDELSERERVAELNLIAGKRAKSSGAYAAAQSYFAVGRVLQGEDSWEQQYDLTLDLELQQAECEIVGGELVTAEQRLNALSHHTRSLTDQANGVCLCLLLYFTTGRNERAVEVALGFLSRVGIMWSSRPTEDEVRQEYIEMRRKLALRPIGDLIDLPAMSDPNCIATMSVLTELFPAAYAVDRYLLELVLLRMTNLSLEYGNCDSSSVAYSALNMALGSHFTDYTTAYGLGKLACQLVERRGADRYKARVYSCFAAFTMPWIEHLPLCQPMMTQAFQIGKSMGDMAFAAYNARNLITHLLASGAPLTQVQREAEYFFAFAKGLQLGLPSERFIGQLGLVKMLRGIPAEYTLADEEWGTQNVEGAPGLAMMVCYHWVFRLQERYFAADIPAASEAAAHVRGIEWSMRSSIEEAEFNFYAALTCAAAVDTTFGEDRDRHLLALSEHFDRIDIWSQNCPENFANRRALIAAEMARIEGRELEAQKLFEEAVRLARLHGFVQNEGLANELAGRFYQELGLETVGYAYLSNARDCFERWGGLAKVKQLDQRYPDLRARALRVSSTATIDTPVTQLDVATVDKASQTLSSEMILPSLLEKLMRLAVEHAGAERGLLILLDGDEPHIEAKATTGRGRVEVTVRRFPVTPSDLSQSALQYVLRTRERLVLNDASAESLDFEDEYVRQNRTRSVLCLPIFKQTKVIGALYLENNLTTFVFTPDRVAVLDFLASQAAIWLENARLYSDLRRSEAWLREAQHLSLTGSFYWRVDLDTVEFSEQTFRIYELDPSVTVTSALIASRIHPEDLPLVQEMVDIARGPGTDLDYVYRARMPDKSVKHLHLVAHGTRDRDGQLAYIGSIQDVTRGYQTEEALSKARSELAHVARITTLGVLTASIAHEVNQPLMGIVTNASTCLRMLAADPPNLEGARRTAERSIRDGHRAADVIKRLRSLFGKKDTTTETVDLNEAAREVIALSSSELQRNRVNVQTDLDNTLPLVRGDRVQLQQVILNLLLNASDAMRDVHDRPRKLVIRTKLDESVGVCLSVQDTGPGLGPQSVERLFEAFYTTKDGGMGMGLSVSRYIIESHRGRLWANSNDGQGAIFVFSIPQTAGTPAPDPGHSAQLSSLTHAEQQP